MYGLTVVFFILPLFTCLCNNLYALSCDIVKVRDFYICTVFQNVNGILSIVTGCCDELIEDFRLLLLCLPYNTVWPFLRSISFSFSCLTPLCPSFGLLFWVRFLRDAPLLFRLDLT